MSCRMSPQKSELSSAINMFSALARPTRFVTASTGRLVSNWYSRGGCHPCTHSGGPAIMRRRNNLLKKITLAGAAAILAPLFISGQQSKPAPPPDSEDAVFSSDTRLVPLNVTVTDKSGRLVTNLPQSAFQVYENGVQQTIRLFKREDVPVSMGLIIDNSGSMREKRQAVETSALAMVRDSNPQDEVFIVNFNDEVYMDTDFTSDIKKMEQGLTKIDSRGGTAMREAIKLSVEHLKGTDGGPGAKRDKKVVLVVTDGNDNASTVSLEALTRLAQQDDVLIYAIALLTEEDRREAKKAQRALQILTDSTGGTV